MRCRNCHTVMMDSDQICPSCGASAASATAAPPALGGGKPNGLLLLLPMFGGALGGLAYGALTAGQNQAPARASSSSSGWRLCKGIFGVLLIVFGGLFLVAASVHFAETWRIAHRQPKLMTSAELSRTFDPGSAPAWIAYSFAESKPANLTVPRRRLGHGGDVQARCLFVRVDDKWLLASVDTGFRGDRLVGRLLPIESSPDSLIERIRKDRSSPSPLLPYEFNAIDGSASDQQVRYTGAGLVSVFGVLGLCLGTCLLGSGGRKQQHPAAV